jgi:hypothetical protein
MINVRNPSLLAQLHFDAGCVTASEWCWVQHCTDASMQGPSEYQEAGFFFGNVLQHDDPNRPSFLGGGEHNHVSVLQSPTLFFNVSDYEVTATPRVFLSMQAVYDLIYRSIDTENWVDLHTLLQRLIKWLETRETWGREQGVLMAIPLGILYYYHLLVHSTWHFP